MPSYQQYLEEAMAKRGPNHPIWEVNDKLAAREIGELADLYVPELIDGPGKLRELSPWKRKRVVIKPLNGCSSRGVVPLVWQTCSSESPTTYTNLFTGKEVTWTQAVNIALADKHTSRNEALLARNHPDAMRPPWLLEELILGDNGGLPDNWKAFCFGGKVVAIFHSRRQNDGSLRIRWWNRDFEDIGDICPAKKWKYDRRMAKPKNPDKLIRGFEDVAELVDSPFVRVDLYERGNEVVFGEITPHPTGGGQHFVPKWDAIFGQAWADAL